MSCPSMTDAGESFHRHDLHPKLARVSRQGARTAKDLVEVLTRRRHGRQGSCRRTHAKAPRAPRILSKDSRQGAKGAKDPVEACSRQDATGAKDLVEACSRQDATGAKDPVEACSRQDATGAKDLVEACSRQDATGAKDLVEACSRQGAKTAKDLVEVLTPRGPRAPRVLSKRSREAQGCESCVRETPRYVRDLQEDPQNRTIRSQSRSVHDVLVLMAA